MKYIDAEKLIAEIERRINSWSIRGKNSPVGQGKDTCESRVTELSDLLSFITSLQQEQPEMDLEKASRNVYESWMGGTMDEVRRDMLTLGTVLNARKEK